jgi:cyclopropane fatty-acyl-phospholipid synthase-like methyltransferase
MDTDYTNKEKAKTCAGNIKSDLLSLRDPLLETVGGVSGKRILDLGCGYGKYSIIFVEDGASDVVGIDISEEQIRLARDRNPHPNIRYI